MYISLLTYPLKENKKSLKLCIKVLLNPPLYLNKLENPRIALYKLYILHGLQPCKTPALVKF